MMRRWEVIQCDGIGEDGDYYKMLKKWEEKIFNFFFPFFQHLVKLFFDGSVDQATPLGPGAVVVADVLVSQQIAEGKPGVAAALTDTAVGDHFLLRCHTLAT